MRKKIFLILMLSSLLPFLAMIGILFFFAPFQKEGLAQRRLATAFIGVSAYFDKIGTDLLAQTRALAAGEAISTALLTADQTGYFNQPLLIESTVRQMTLINLDYLVVTDPQGVVLSQGQEPTVLGFSAAGDSLIGRAARGQEVHTLGLRDINGRAAILVVAASPVWFRNRVLGAVETGVIIGENQLNAIKGLSGAELGLISEGVTQGSTIRENIDQDILFLQNDVVGSMRINGRPYIFASFPLSDFSGKKIADLLIGISVADIETVIDNLSRTFVLLAACGIILAVFLGWSVTSRAIAQINDLSDGFSAVSSGDFTAKISLNRNDEFGDLAMAFNEMVTELKDRQEQIVETERLAILTQMAQKIVPRLTMPTESIGRGIAEIRKFAAAEYQTQSTVIEKLCQAIATETNILAKIAGEFAEFARFPAANMVDQKLDSLMDELSVFYDKEIQSGNLAIQVVDRGLMVAIDKELIRRALNIVLENAFEAAGPSGRVELRVSDARGYAAIEIVDSGPGFSDLAKKNLFAPFFTTKMDGSGLSLIMAKRIMAEHDGAIEIEDNLGGGTMVRLRLKITGKA